MQYPQSKYSLLLSRALQQLKFDGKPKELYQPISYTLSLGGKRIRPLLCLLGNQLFNGKIDDALPVALGIEIFHNFTLVHDDIMDEAPLRRGKPTVHEKWNRDIAILSGDVMFVKAYEQLLQAETEKLPLLLALFNQTAIQVCEGQQLDMIFENTKKVSLKEYLKMIELKTAVLLAFSLKAGALTANASNENAELIYSFGKNIGLAFQIQDDYLDAYAKAEKFGKQIGGDILQNKKTYLLLTAEEEADEKQKLRLKKLIEGKMKEEEKIERTISLYNQLKVPQLSRLAMEKYFKKGMQALNKIKSTNPKAKTELSNLAKTLMGREV